MHRLCIVGLLTIAVELSFAQIPTLGLCPSIQPVQNLDINSYTGQWFEAEKLFFVPEITDSCVSVRYDRNGPALNTEIRFTETVTGLPKVYSGVTRFLEPLVNDNTGNGRMQLQLTDTPFIVPVPVPQTTLTFPYTVVATVPNVYTIKFSCRQLPFNLIPFVPFNFQSVWVLVRDRSYPDAVRAQVRDRLRQLGISTSFLVRTDQNCPRPANIRSAELKDNDLARNATLAL